MTFVAVGWSVCSSSLQITIYLLLTCESIYSFGISRKSVNLEKAMRLGDRLDGHIVSGHVDGVGEVDAFEKVAESYRLVVRCPMKLAKFLAYKGSVAINGVSLTINEVEDTPAGTRISINLIPHTFEHTAFKHTKKRDLVNVEVDTVARYIERMYSVTEHK